MLEPQEATWLHSYYDNVYLAFRDCHRLFCVLLVIRRLHSLSLGRPHVLDVGTRSGLSACRLDCPKSLQPLAIFVAI